MKIVAIDPGPEKSAYLLWDSAIRKPTAMSEQCENNELREILRFGKGIGKPDAVACEMVAHYGSGMPVGKEIFETCVWVGRFTECALSAGSHFHVVYRQAVKMFLCRSMRAKDKNIRQALIDLLGPQGRKKDPGPTYGISGHLWAALAVAVTFENLISTSDRMAVKL